MGPIRRRRLVGGGPASPLGRRLAEERGADDPDVATVAHALGVAVFDAREPERGDGGLAGAPTVDHDGRERIDDVAALAEAGRAAVDDIEAIDAGHDLERAGGVVGDREAIANV